mmetsp:Transcript_55883/g.130542  ORF Transcript_55883/g.130542 Transcript_55883/m.130542 type:complete len:151 (+) Transcript_55883:82-534(+)
MANLDMDRIFAGIKADIQATTRTKGWPENWLHPTRSGDWLLVVTVEDRGTVDDTYNSKLYHLPSWVQGSKPLLQESWVQRGWVRPSGRELRFGEPGQIKVVDVTRGEVLRTIELEGLLPKELDDAAIEGTTTGLSAAEADPETPVCCPLS